MAGQGRRAWLVVAVLSAVLVLVGPASGASSSKADYIVVLDESVLSAQAVADEHANNLNGKLKHVYE